MDQLAIVADAVTRATEALAGHAARNHRGCEQCVDVAALLLEAQDALEDAMRLGSDVRLIGALMSRN